MQKLKQHVFMMITDTVKKERQTVKNTPLSLARHIFLGKTGKNKL